MNKWLRFGLMSFVSLSLVLSGCGQKEHAAAPSAPKTEKPRELTYLEVLRNSADVMVRNGYSYDLTGKIAMTMNQNGLEQKVSMGLQFTADVTNQPHAMHLKGTVSMLGPTMPMETYFVGNEMYQKMEGLGWIKTKGVQIRPGGENESPADELKAFVSLFGSSNGNEPPKGLTMKKEAGSYVLELDMVTLKQNKEFEKRLSAQVQEMLKGTPGLEKKDMTKVLNKIKYDRFKEKIWIDEKTFRYQKAELDVNMDMEGLKLEEHLQMNVKGDFNGKIEVPEQVKKKARSM